MTERNDGWFWNKKRLGWDYDPRLKTAPPEWTKKGQGPDIDLVYWPTPDRRLARSAVGKKLVRIDVLDKGNWHDWQFVNNETGATKAIASGGREVLGPLGESVWASSGAPDGPEIPANADCAACHKFSEVKSGADLSTFFASRRDAPKVEFALWERLVPAHGDRGKKYEVIVKEGPRGPAGPQGLKGDPGGGADNELIIRTLNESMTKKVIAWLEDHKDQFKGPRGEPGEPGGPGEVDYEVLVTEVIKKLPPLTVNFMARDGVARSVSVPVGGTLDIPPVRLNLYDDLDGNKVMSDSETFRLVEPLGQPIRIEVTGGINAAGKKPVP